MKKVIRITSAPGHQWVGDGFPVHDMFGYSGGGMAAQSVPAARLCGADQFAPNARRRRSVGEHPHGGFETATIVCEGEVEHRDSIGKGGVMGVETCNG